MPILVILVSIVDVSKSQNISHQTNARFGIAR